MTKTMVATAMLAGALSSDVNAEISNTFKRTRLHLELVKTGPVPVIWANHPDTKDIPAGFEAGTTVTQTYPFLSRNPR